MKPQITVRPKTNEILNPDGTPKAGFEQKARLMHERNAERIDMSGHRGRKARRTNKGIRVA